MGGFDLKKNIFASLAAFLVLASCVAALPEGVTNVTVVSNTTAATTGAENMSIYGGYIYDATLAAETQTQLWAAVYGNASGNITLRNAGGVKLYNWLLSNTTGQVYATTSSSVPSWLNIAAVNYSCIDSVFNYTSSWTDSAANTFLVTNPVFSVGAVSIPATANTSVLTYNSSALPFWYTVALADNAPDYSNVTCNLSKTNFVFSGLLSSNQPAFDGSTADYQILLPENEKGSSAATTFFFYLELT